MRAAQLFIVLIFLSLSHANFTYIGYFNGSNKEEYSNAYAFSYPSGVLYEGGKIYVVDSSKNAFYVMNGTVREKAVLASSGESPLSNPMHMAYDSGVVYIADGLGAAVKTYSGEGFQIDKWMPGSSTNLQKPSGVALDKDYLYVTDLGKEQLLVFKRSSRAFDHIGVEKGESDGELSAPEDVEIYGDKIFISDSGKGLVFAYNKSLGFLYTIGRGKGGVTLYSPRGIEVYQDRLYVADASTNRIVVFTMDGYPMEILNTSNAGTSITYPMDVSLGDGKLYVADSGSSTIKMFAINNETAPGDEAVLQKLRFANDSLAYLVSLQAIAKKLNLTYNESTAAPNLALAQADYDNFVFSSADSLAQKSLDASKKDGATLSQQIEIAVLQLIKNAQDKVAPYRTQESSGELADRLNQFDNTASDAQKKLGSKYYDSAADSAIYLGTLADDFILRSKGKVAEEEKKQQQSLLNQMSLDIQSLSARIGKLKASAETYRSQINLSNSESLLLSSQKYMSDGDFASANRSLALAQLEVSSYEALLVESSKEIDVALANISIIEFSINESIAKPSLIPADFAPERTLILQAKDTAYDNPQLALVMARQAAESAAKKAREAQSLSMTAAALLVVFGMTAVVAFAFLLHLRGRRRKRQQPPEQKKPLQDSGPDASEEKSREPPAGGWPFGMKAEKPEGGKAGKDAGQEGGLHQPSAFGKAKPHSYDEPSSKGRPPLPGDWFWEGKKDRKK